MKYSCVIVGGGIVGCSIFSLLARNGVSVALVEKGEDVALGATKANSGIIHAGYDCEPNTLKAKLNVIGNKMYASEAKRLGEKLINCGSIVVADKDGFSGIEVLYNKGITNGVSKMKILKKDAIKKLIPNVNENIEYALHAKTASIASPYNFCIAYCEEAIINGGKLYLNAEIKTCKQKETFDITLTNGEKIECDFVVNCAGSGVNEVSKKLGAAEGCA